MITKIREGLYLGDSSAQLELEEPIITIDLTGWKFDLAPMKKYEDNEKIWNLVNTLSTAQIEDVPVLIKCHGGIDRSPFIVACYLAFDNWCETDKDDFLDNYIISAYEEVKAAHPQTFIHDDWIKWWINPVIVEEKVS